MQFLQTVGNNSCLKFTHGGVTGFQSDGFSKKVTDFQKSDGSRQDWSLLNLTTPRFEVYPPSIRGQIIDLGFGRATAPGPATK